MACDEEIANPSPWGSQPKSDPANPRLGLVGELGNVALTDGTRTRGEARRELGSGRPEKEMHHPQTADTMAFDSSKLDRVGYLFGHPIAHSFSPLLHQTIYNELKLRWAQIPFESTDMAKFLEMTKDPKFFGASVTMPHKVKILQHLDVLEPAARDVGACNTIFVRHDPHTSARLLVGTNTDIVGIREAFYQNVPNPDQVFHGRPAVIVGGGGAARSAAYALRKSMNVKQIYIVNRDAAEAEAVIADCVKGGYGNDMVYVSTTAQAEGLESAGAIVACVPDFEPTTEDEKRARAVLQCFLTKPHKGAILEMCYHPRTWTRIAEISKKAGWKVILGTEALIYQGLEQDRYWTGRDIQNLPSRRVKAVIASKL